MLLLVTISNCSTGPVGSLLFTKTNFEGSSNFDSSVRSTKSATGCLHSVLGLVSWGNAGAGQIASDNDIRRIATIDHSNMHILIFFYSRYCTVVYGE